MGPHGSHRRESQVTPVPDADTQDPPRLPEQAAPGVTMSEFASHLAKRLFSVALRLDRAHSIAGNGPAGDEIAVAADEIDQLISDIRATVVNSAEDPLAAFRKRGARTARELQARALEAAGLLERQAYIARQPSRLDYQAEIKRWRAFAGEAEQMASQWEQPP